MRRLLSLTFWFLFSGLFAFSHSIRAEEGVWKINVPVDVKKIPAKIKYVGVMATLKTQKTMPGASTKWEPINPNGSFKKTITLYIPDDPKKNKVPLNLPTSYGVALCLSIDGYHVLWTNFPDGKDPLTKADLSKPYVSSYSGDLMWKFGYELTVPVTLTMTGMRGERGRTPTTIDTGGEKPILKPLWPKPKLPKQPTTEPTSPTLGPKAEEPVLKYPIKPVKKVTPVSR